MAKYKYYEDDDEILISYRKNGKDLSFNNKQVIAIVDKAIKFISLETNGTILTALNAAPIIYLRPEDHSCDTMCTEGKFIYIQPRFVVSSYCAMDNPEKQGFIPIAFAIIHECMHNILMHHVRGKSYEGKYSHTLLNYAMDFEINTLLEVMIPDFFTLCSQMGFLMNYYYFKGDTPIIKSDGEAYAPKKSDSLAYIFKHPHYGKKWEDMIDKMPKPTENNNQQQQQSQSSDQSQTVSVDFQAGFDEGALQKIAEYRAAKSYPDDILDNLEKQILDAAKKRSAQLTESQSVNSDDYDKGWNAGYDFIDRILNGGFNNNNNGGSSNLDTPSMPNNGSDKNNSNNSDSSKGNNGNDSTQSGNENDSDNGDRDNNEGGDFNGNGNDDEGDNPMKGGDPGDPAEGNNHDVPNERGVPVPSVDEINDALNKAAGKNGTKTIEADDLNSFMMDGDNFSDSEASRLREECGFNDRNKMMERYNQDVKSEGESTFTPDNMKSMLNKITNNARNHTGSMASHVGDTIGKLCDDIKGDLIEPDDDTFVDWREELADKLNSLPKDYDDYKIDQIDTEMDGGDIISYSDIRDKHDPRGTEIACFIDVSGSVSEIVLDKFVHEVNQIIYAADVHYVRIAVFAGKVPKDGTPGNIRIDLDEEGKYAYKLPGSNGATTLGDVFRCIDEIYFDYAPDGRYYFKDEDAPKNDTKLDAVIIFTDEAVNENHEIASIPQEWIDGDEYRKGINERTIWVAVNGGSKSFVPPIEGNEVIEVSKDDFHKVNVIIDKNNTELIKEGFDFGDFSVDDEMTDDETEITPVDFKEHEYGDYLIKSNTILKNTFEVSDIVKEFLFTAGFITSEDKVNCVTKEDGDFTYTDIFVSSLYINGSNKVNTKLPENSFILKGNKYFKNYYDLSFLNGKSLDFKSLYMLMDQLAKLLTGESNMYIYDEIHRPVLVITDINEYIIENFNGVTLSKNPAVAEDNSCLQLNKAENLIFENVLLNVPSVYLPKSAAKIIINNCELAPGGSVSELNRMSTKGYVDDDEWYEDTVTVYGKIMTSKVEGFLIPAIGRKVISNDIIYECSAFNAETYNSTWSRMRDVAERDKYLLPIVNSSWHDDETSVSGRVPVTYEKPIQIEPKLGRKIVNKEGTVYVCMNVKKGENDEVVSIWKNMSKIYLPTRMNLPEDTDTVEINGLTAKDKSGKPFTFNAITMGMDGIDYIFPSKYKFVINKLNDVLGTNVRWINKIVNNRKLPK